VQGVDVAPLFEALIRLTVLNSLPEGLGINGLTEQRSEGGVGRTIWVEEALPRGNEGGNPWADAPTERPEPLFIDMARFPTFGGQELVVHGDHVIEEAFLHLDKKTEDQGVTPRGRKAA